MPRGSQKYLWAALCWALVIAALWLAALLSVARAVSRGARRGGADGTGGRDSGAARLAQGGGRGACDARRAGAAVGGSVCARVEGAWTCLRILRGRCRSWWPRRADAGAAGGACSSPRPGRGGYLSALDSLGEACISFRRRCRSGGLELVARTAQASPDTLLFAVTAGIGTYFASASYPQLTAFLAAQIPAGLRRRFPASAAI